MKSQYMYRALHYSASRGKNLRRTYTWVVYTVSGTGTRMLITATVLKMTWDLHKIT